MRLALLAFATTLLAVPGCGARPPIPASESTPARQERARPRARSGAAASADRAPVAAHRKAHATGEGRSHEPHPAKPEARARITWQRLPVPGFGDAWLTKPATLTRALPVVLAVHGAGDNAELKCEFWSELLLERALVLCPRGTAFDARAGENSPHFFRNHHALEAEALAALAALGRELGEWVAPGPVLYVAYSQGATMGALFVVRHPDVFSRLVLVEGGGDQWNLAVAQAYEAGGGERVLFVCGTGDCARRAARAASWLERKGLRARSEHVERGGHTYFGSVGGRLAELLPWILEGDARFER